jgi:hypothetical protein
VERTYRLLPDDPGYRVGSDGSVWTCLARRGGYAYVPTDDWRELKQVPTNTGYFCLSVRGKYRYVHTLVLEAFVGPCPAGLECCHADDNGFNNVQSNLRWDTPKANATDRYRNGRQPRGETSPRSKLTADDVRAIRTEHAAGKSMKRIAGGHGIDPSQVSNIVHRRQWAHVP